MACEIISGIESFPDFLVYPTTCDYFFYLKILLGIGIILAWTLFKFDEKRTGKADLISALGVSSIAMAFFALIGSLVTNTAGIPMIQSDILLILVAIATAASLLWIFKD